MNESDVLLEKAHSQVIAQYGFHFSKTRVLDPTFHKWLNTAFKLRQLADYQTEVSVQPEEVDDLISGCRQFIAAASLYVEELQADQGPAKPE